jgi:hypothetical protein
VNQTRQLLKRKRNPFQMYILKTLDIFNQKMFLILLVFTLVSCTPTFEVIRLKNEKTHIDYDKLARENPDEFARRNYGLDQTKLNIVFETSMIGDSVLVRDKRGMVYFDKKIAFFEMAEPEGTGRIDLKINGLLFEIPINTYRNYQYLIVKKKFNKKNKYILTYTNQLPVYW